eukprot:Hpha_TRINITY_DN19428_c0_g1::TRINITY_DN19428_c0_g1_i1::g.45674::m.45674
MLSRSPRKRPEPGSPSPSARRRVPQRAGAAATRVSGLWLPHSPRWGSPRTGRGMSPAAGPRAHRSPSPRPTVQSPATSSPAARRAGFGRQLPQRMSSASGPRWSRQSGDFAVVGPLEYATHSRHSRTSLGGAGTPREVQCKTPPPRVIASARPASARAAGESETAPRESLTESSGQNLLPAADEELDFSDGIAKLRAIAGIQHGRSQTPPPGRRAAQGQPMALALSGLLGILSSQMLQFAGGASGGSRARQLQNARETQQKLLETAERLHLVIAQLQSDEDAGGKQEPTAPQAEPAADEPPSPVNGLKKLRQAAEGGCPNLKLLSQALKP